MFQEETPNNRFKYLDTGCKGHCGQRSPKVIQDHLGSLGVKNKIITISHILVLVNSSKS